MSSNLGTSQTQNPLGTQSIRKLIAQYSIPAIISMIVNALYNIVDQIFVGQGIGLLGNAATNVAFPLTTVCTAIGLLIGLGSASNFNLKLGAGKKDEAAVFAGNGVSFSIILGAILGIIVFIFVEPMLVLFGATPAVMTYALPYTTIVAVGVPFLIFSTVASNLIRADGSPKYAMAVMLSGAIFNIIFDPVFMIGLDMGIEGIALATTLGQVLSTCVAAFYLVRKFRSTPMKHAQLKPRSKAFTAIVSLGSAACFNQLAMMVVQIVMNNLLSYYGAQSNYGSEIPLAAVGVITKVIILIMSFVIGVAQGCQPIVSFNYGAKNYDRVKQTYKTAVLMVTVISCIAFACIQLFPRQIVSIFGEGSEEYFTFAEKYMRIFLLMTFINGIQPVTSNFFTSIGKARKGIFISLTRQIIFLLPLILILPMFMGIEGVLYAGPIADGVSAFLAILFIFREFKDMTRLQAALPQNAAPA